MTTSASSAQKVADRGTGAGSASILLDDMTEENRRRPFKSCARRLEVGGDYQCPRLPHFTRYLYKFGPITQLKCSIFQSPRTGQTARVKGSWQFSVSEVERIGSNFSPKFLGRDVLRSASRCLLASLKNCQSTSSSNFCPFAICGLCVV